MADLEKEIRSLIEGMATEAENQGIFLDLYPRVWRFFRGKGYTSEEAEDHTQEVLDQVFQRADSCRDPDRFKSWVFAIAANHHRNEVRDQQAGKRQRKEIGLDDLGFAEAEAVVSEGVASPERAVLSKELREVLSASIATLSPKRRRAFLMSCQGRPYEEIARVLGVTVGTVKAHVYQARQDLKAKLAGYLDDDTPGGADDDDES